MSKEKVDNKERKYVKILPDGSIRLGVPDAPNVKVTETVAEALSVELAGVDDPDNRYVRAMRDRSVWLQLPNAPTLRITRELAVETAKEFDAVMDEIDKADGFPPPPGHPDHPTRWTPPTPSLSLVQDTDKRKK